MKFENIADLRVLVETARGGSLTAAARALELTPAAASAMLKRLEAEVGARLFERSTRAMRLTEQGQTLLDYAVRAIDLLQEGASQAASQAGLLRGAVRVAAPSDLSHSLLLGWFDEFLLRHPGVQIALSVSDRLQDVRRDAVDLAVRYGPLADSQLVARRLCVTRRLACAAPAYVARRGAPTHPSELAEHDCLALHIGGRRELRWQFEPAGGGEGVAVAVSGARSVDDGAVAHAWALAGQCVVYKSALDVRAHLQSGALVPLLPGWLGQRYEVNAVLPSNRFVPARVRALVEHLAERFASLPAPEGAAG